MTTKNKITFVSEYVVDQAISSAVSFDHLCSVEESANSITVGRDYKNRKTIVSKYVED